MYIDYIFNFSNLLVLPFWLLMIAIPNWEWTRKIMSSYIPFVILAAMYIYCFANINPDSFESLASPNLSQLAEAFADETTTATGWVHFVVMDLFVGRWIYWKGQETKVWTCHSLALCLFAGPLGLLSHIVTNWISQSLGKETTDATA
ncbi:MAG: ABA4-like family protein [Cyanobacteria bacterium P01_F01_bin.150]